MRRIFLQCLFMCLAFFCSSHIFGQVAFVSGDLYFIENVGQIVDQSACNRNDIRYMLQAPGIGVFVGKAQLHYQFYKRDACGAEAAAAALIARGVLPSSGIPGLEDALPASVATYRMDVSLEGANVNPEVIASDRQAYFENYYQAGAQPAALKASTFKKITLKNVYRDIDWVIYANGAKLEHEFVVGPHGNPSDIRLKYDGQTSLTLNNDGSISAATPMGIIKEHAPVCYKKESLHEEVAGAFKLNGNVLTFDVNNLPGEGLVIDPVVEWSTYYGPNSSSSSFYSMALDHNANVYVCGLTYSAAGIATSGSFQDTLSGTSDAFLVKFDSSGHRIWSTYYGNSSGTGAWATALACDPAGNVYVGGQTDNTSGIATPGAQETTFVPNELWCGFLVKFNAAGDRIWGTYVGGTESTTNSNDLEIATVFVDTSWNLYITGSTDDSSNVGTPGTWKPWKHTGPDTTINDYIIKYDTAGRRQWGTYYGADYANKSYTGGGCTDGMYVYLSGYTVDTEGYTIASPGGYEPVYKGGLSGEANIAFLAKFDNTGNRIWGTYYGDTSSLVDTWEQTGGITCDHAGNIYMQGSAYNSTFMGTSGCFQPVFGGGVSDAFLAKFDPEAGFRLWGTFYGGPGEEDDFYARSMIACDNSNNIYITGNTNSTSGIASSGAWQPTYGGGDNDAFLAAFDASGHQLWSTYFGGDSTDIGMVCAFDGYGLYLCGYTTSPSNIATTGSFLDVGGSGTNFYQGFLAKFADPPLHSVSPLSSISDLAIYPNPNNGEFILTGKMGNVTNNVQVIISDVSGKAVYNGSASVLNGVLSQAFDLNRLVAGVYVMQVIGTSGANSIQFIKE